MKVGDICTKDTIHVRRQEPLLSVAKLMRKFHVGTVIVVDGADDSMRPIGMITDRDLVLEVLAPNIDISTLIAGDVLTRELVTVNAGHDLREALNHLRYFGVRRAPVVDDYDYLLGLFSIDDSLPVLSEELSEIVRLMSNQLNNEIEPRLG